MGNSRDDFTSATKELLANRVGRRCSNPACRKLTCGANTNPEKITNIGVAAHICAAAQGGPRYDASMTPEERKSFENGIWLCQSCSKLIDMDITRYPKELLQSWKQLAEQTAILEVEMEMSRNVQSGNTQNLKSMVIQRSFPKWSVAERRKTAAASDQAAVCACAHSRYFAGGSPSGLRV